MREKEINLIDLVVEILLRWRVFIIWMLVGAVLLGTFSYVQSYRTFKSQTSQVEAAEKQLEQELVELEQGAESTGMRGSALRQWLLKQLTDTQIRNVEYVLEYEALRDDRVSYQENSVLMKIDPNSVAKGELTFLVSSEQKQKSYDIERVYEDIVSSGEMSEIVAQQLGVDEMNVSEIFYIARGTSGLLEGTDTFKVILLCDNEKNCKNVMQAVVNFLNAKQVELVEILGEHDITLINQSCGTVTHTGIMNTQRTNVNDIMSMEDTITKYKNNFGVEEWKYYDFCLNGELTELSEEKAQEIKESTQDTEGTGTTLTDIINRGVTVTPGVSVKYMILGAILAAFIYAFIIFLRYALNTKLRGTDDLQKLCNIQQFGRIPNRKIEKKTFAFVDKWILALRDRNNRRFTNEEALELASVGVKMAVKKEACTFVSIIGCDLKEQSLLVSEEIKKSFDSDNVKVNILNNVLYDAQAMGELDGTQGAILVERAGSTLYNEIFQELELLRRQGIKVLGGIVVE